MKFLRKTNKLASVLGVFFFIGSVASCSETSVVLLNSVAITLPDGKVIKMGDTKAQILKTLGDPGSYDEDPAGEVLNYLSLGIGIHLNNKSQVDLLGFYFSMRDEKGNTFPPHFLNFHIDGVEINGSDTADIVLKKLTGTNLSFRTEEKSSYKSTTIALGEDKYIFLRFPKAREYRISAIQYYKRNDTSEVSQ